METTHTITRADTIRVAILSMISSLLLSLLPMVVLNGIMDSLSMEEFSWIQMFIVTWVVLFFWMKERVKANS